GGLAVLLETRIRLHRQRHLLVRHLRILQDQSTLRPRIKIRVSQGEGDYDADRRYRKDTMQFVKEHTKDGKTIKGDAAKSSNELTPAEREGLSHAKDPGQDKRDAKLMDKLEKKRS
ncbi:MAG: hypothetical protein ABI132_07160, partial [Rhodanobacteraceae bacterium]